MPPRPEHSTGCLPASAQALHAHPGERAPEGLTLQAAVAAVGSEQGPGWLFEYLLRGPVATLRLPAPAEPGPADGLWRHSCLEAFVQHGDGPAYTEFNFSPSGQWAVYRFERERQRLAGDAPHEGPQIDCGPVDGGWRLLAWVPCHLLPQAPGAMGLNAVLETTDGQLSHWALAHPRADRPDFHHPGGWVRPPALPPCPERSR